MVRDKIILKHFFILLFFILFSPLLFSQNETANWYFGKYCGLTFNTNTPSAINSTLFNSPEGGASISDANGNLLFYTNAATIWNQAQAVMANGAGLNGDPSSSQSAIIIKQPGSNANYFVFTQAGGFAANGLQYSIVDMGLAAGMGSVTVKNVPLYTPSCEKLHAVKHCNGTDVWIVTHDLPTDVFRCYLLTAGGLNPVPVLSSVGSVYGPGNTLGCLKVSPNGKKIASATFSGNSVELFDFNAATGVLSNSLIVSSALSLPYGIEFSPDGTKLYASEITGNGIVQWDLCTGNKAAIISSSVIIPVPNTVGSLQLAQNGRIYVSELNKTQLSLINNPNAAGLACNFVSTIQGVGTGTTQFGLPNFVAGFFREAVSYSFTQNCSAMSFTAPSLASGCDATETYTSLAWSFGDPASGALNTSTLSTVNHTFNAVGTYTVKLVLYSGCGSDSVSRVITTQALNVDPGFSICPGNTATLQAGGADSYSWNTGVTTSSLSVSPGTTTSYTVTGTYTNGCVPNSSVVTVSVSPAPSLTISGTQTICKGKRLTLAVSGATAYLWNNGVTTSTINAFPIGNTNYTVTCTGANGCTIAAVIPITVNVVPQLSITGQTICAGASATLTNLLPSAGANYTWQPGNATTNPFVVMPAVTTVYTVTAELNGCYATLSNTILVKTIVPAITGFSYTPACLNDPAPTPDQDANFTFGGSYSSVPELPIDPVSGLVTLDPGHTGTFVIAYSVAAQNCMTTNTHTTLLVIEKAPVLNVSPDIRIGPGSSATLTASGATTYSWEPAVNMSCNTCSDPIVSPSQNIQYCVIAGKNQCQVKACINVAVTCDSGGDFSLPNAFSPNGDGFNDEFCLQGWDLCVVKFSAIIFNRWGEKVYESTNASFCWDGSYNGKILDTDVLAYMISAKFSNGATINKTGNITLLR